MSDGYFEKLSFCPNSALRANILLSEYQIYACGKIFASVLILNQNPNFARYPDMFKQYLIIFILLSLVGCKQEKTEWNPIFEETSFDYFTTEIDRTLSLIDSAYLEANEDKQESIQENLSQAKNRLLEIKDYYIPFTTVRQKIYDAERYYKLKDIKKSEKLLEDSKSIIKSLDITTKSEVFDKVILDLTSMINEVISSFDEGSMPNTYNKMKILGEHVNLMLFKGDLVLSGIKFNK